METDKIVLNDNGECQCVKVNRTTSLPLNYIFFINLLFHHIFRDLLFTRIREPRMNRSYSIQTAVQKWRMFRLFSYMTDVGIVTSKNVVNSIN